MAFLSAIARLILTLLISERDLEADNENKPHWTWRSSIRDLWKRSHPNGTSTNFITASPETISRYKWAPSGEEFAEILR